MGLRSRYWTIDAAADLHVPHSIDASDDATLRDIAIGVGVEAQTLDLELTQRADLGPMQLQVAGGFRYGKMCTDLGASGVESVFNEQTYGYDDSPFAGSVAADFEGVGPTVALGVRRPFGGCRMALVGDVRGSWLYGHTNAYPTGDLIAAMEEYAVSGRAGDHMMQVWEVQLGLEWTRPAACGELVARAVWEAQAWEWAPLASLLHQDVGFSGPTFSLGYVW